MRIFMLFNLRVTLALLGMVTSASAASPGFGNTVDFPAGIEPIDVDAADLDGDGRPDLVIASYLSQSITLYHNRGGTEVSQDLFGDKFELTLPGHPFRVVVSDFDRDGKPDIFAALHTQGRILYFRNIHSTGVLSPGSFAAPVEISVPGTSGFLAVGDVDGDGKMDLVVGDSDVSRSVQLLRQRGVAADGTTPLFDPVVSLPTGAGPSDPILADLDGDGRPEVVAPDGHGSTVVVFQNLSSKGSLSVDGFGERISLPSDGWPQTVAVADLDGDGRPDIGAVNSASGTVTLYRNVHTNGLLTATSFADPVRLGGSSDYYSIQFIDVDGDGLPDMVTAGPGGVRYRHNAGLGGGITTSTFDPPVVIPCQKSVVGQVTSDLNGDGMPDIATANFGNASISLFEGYRCTGELAFTTEPEDVHVDSRASASLSARASPATMFTYQWFHASGTPVPNATGSVLSFPSASIFDADAYYAVATSPCGSLTSRVARVIVRPGDSSVIAWWKADGNTVEQLSQQPAATEDVAYSEGPDGQAFSFDGIGTRVFVGDWPQLAFTDQWTFTFRIQLPTSLASGASAGVISRGDGGPGLDPYSIGVVSPSSLLLTTSDASSPAVSLTADLPVGVWVHVTCAFDHGTARFYLDGKPVAERTGLAIPYVALAPGGGFSFGNATTPWNFPLKGALDDIVAYSRALTADEVAEAAAVVGPLQRGFGPPAMLAEPADQHVGLGGIATFSVLASGEAPLGFQWLKDHVLIPDATNRSLRITGAGPSARGAYSVIVSNALGVIESRAAVLSIDYPPSHLSLGAVDGAANREVQVPILITSAGIEHELHFSLHVDPTLGSFVSAVTATDGTLVVDVSDAAHGNIGLNLSLPPGNLLPAGLQTLVTAGFRLSPLSAAAPVAVSFGDLPVPRQLRDSDGFPIPGDYEAGRISILPTRVHTLDVSSSMGATIQVPVVIESQGNEHSLGFSLSFDPGLLSFAGVALGDSVPSDASLLVNDAHASDGRLGILLALAGGGLFQRGTQDLVEVRFQAAVLADSAVTPITLIAAPVTLQVSDAEAHSIAAAYAGSKVTLSGVRFEGDVAPRPGGDALLSAIDWVQVGRFVAGLDPINGPEEFQRVDCAPRQQGGNGVISATDWVQAGRYAAGIDPRQPAGGPDHPQSGAELPAAARPRARLASLRSLGFADLSTLAGPERQVAVVLQSTGDETALGFSLQFDPAQLAFKAAALGADAHGAVLQLNASQAPQGRLGVAMAIPASGLFQQGERQILVLSLEARSSVGLSSQLSFGDQPVVRDISDVNAQGLAAGFTPLVITVPPFGPRLGFSFSNGTLVLYWSTQASGFHLETSSGSPGGSWTPFSGAPVVIGDQNVVPVGTPGAPAYFRLSRP